MDKPKERPWLFLAKVTNEGESTDVAGSLLVNLNAVAFAEVVSMSELTLHFNQTFKMTVHGLAATETMRHLLDHSILPTGEPFPNFPNKTQETASPKDPDQEP